MFFKKNNNIQTEPLNKYRFIAGGLSGIVEVLCTHPLDYVKTKRQEYIQRFNSITPNFYKDISTNGIRSFYTGVTPRVLGVIPMRLTFWGVQDTTNCLLKQYSINKSYNFLIIGSVGGFFQSIIDNQIELIKIFQMTKTKYKISDIFLKYNGFNATLSRNIGFACFVSYFCFGKKPKTDIEKFINSSIGGLVGSIVTQPLDYIKTLQQRTNTGDSIKKIFLDTLKNNPKHFFTGCYYRSILGMFTMGIGFVAYDKFYKLLYC